MANNTVTKRDLAGALAEKNGLNQKDALSIIQSLQDQIIEELSNGNRLELRDFGVFEPRIRKGQRARNPRTGEEVYAREKATVRFKAGKKMREDVQGCIADLKMQD